MEATENHIVGGRYHLQTILGAGSAGVVWQAQDSELSRLVAIKLLTIENDLHRARVLREARVAALLSASAAVSIFDFGDDGEFCFLVMELMSDPTLEHVLQTRGRLPAPLPLRIGIGLAEAMVQAHKLNIVHRDLKPANIFVAGLQHNRNAPVEVRLADFGLAFQDSKLSGSIGRLTQGNALCGTPAYLSPEQARGAENVGPPSDIYSAGCILYELCCGLPPFVGPVAELLSRHIYVPPIALEQRDNTIAPELSLLVDTMLAKDPAMRPDATQMLEELKKLCKENPQTLRRRSARNTGSLPREKRMVQTTQEKNPEHHPALLGSRAFIQGPCDEELRAALLRFGISQNSLEDADFILVADWDSPEYQKDIATSLPMMAWVSSEAQSQIGLLIRLGFSDILSSKNSVEQVGKKLSRLHRRRKK